MECTWMNNSLTLRQPGDKFIFSHLPAFSFLFFNSFAFILSPANDTFWFMHLSIYVYLYLSIFLVSVMFLLNVEANTPMGAHARGPSLYPPYNTNPRQVFMQAPFLSEVPHGRLYQLAQAMNSVRVPSASSTQDYLLQKQPGEHG